MVNIAEVNEADYEENYDVGFYPDAFFWMPDG